MDSRKASYFLAVVDEGSFSAAARVLHLSQPALSLAVKELERELGAPLLERKGRGVVVTQAGSAFADHARRALSEFESGHNAVRDIMGLIGGRLKISCLPSLASVPVALSVGTFRMAHPRVAVEMQNANDPEEVIASIRSGRVEVGISSSTGLPDDVRGIDVGEQSLRLIFPPGSSVPEPFPLKGLAGRDVVAFPLGASLRTILDAALSDLELRAQIAVEVSARDAVIPLVLSGAGAALVPDHVAQVAHARGAVVATPSPALRRDLLIIHRPGKLSPAATAFIDHVRKVVDPYSPPL